MELSKNYYRQNRTALFDWLVFITSMSLGFVYPDLFSFITSPEFYGWMLASALLYVVGTILKQLPLWDRMIRSGKSRDNVPMLLFLLIGHWLILFIVLIFAEPAIRKLLHFPPITRESGTDGTLIWIEILVAVLITWLVFRSPGKKRKPSGHTEVYLFYRELLADFFLLTSISIFSFAFWEKGVMRMLSSRIPQSLSDVWFSFVLLCIAYLMIYLPLRYLYLVEDHTNRQTWRRLFLIFGFLLLRSLITILF